MLHDAAPALVSAGPPSFQRIVEGDVLNLTRLGRRFQQMCRQQELTGELSDYGFMDGGCLSLALAVQAALGEHICQIRYCCTKTQAQHAVAYFAPDVFGPDYTGPAMCLDSDGLASVAEVGLKMRLCELTVGCHYFRELTLAQAEAQGIVDIDTCSRRLAPWLRGFFLDFPFSASWLSERLSAAEVATVQAQIRGGF